MVVHLAASPAPIGGILDCTFACTLKLGLVDNYVSEKLDAAIAAATHWLLWEKTKR